jgi:DNA-binding transcriptional regulator/RsmH inhibitor MraZ
MGNSLIGSYAAKIDKSGRIKIPEKFRTAIESEYGKEVFITSLTDEAVQVYPLSVWEELTGVANAALRIRASLQEEVEVIGLNNHLEVWNKELLDEKLEKKPLTDEDFESIASLIPRGKSE